MIHASIDPTFTAWRSAARGLLRDGVPPDQVVWSDARAESDLLPGVRTVERILSVRRFHRIRLDDLVKLRVPFKRVRPFVLCDTTTPTRCGSTPPTCGNASRRCSDS